MRSVTPCLEKRHGPVPVHSLNHFNCTSIEILLKNVRHKKCDPLFWEDRHDPVYRPNLHNLIIIVILLKKVQHLKCDSCLG